MGPSRRYPSLHRRRGPDTKMTAIPGAEDPAGKVVVITGASGGLGRAPRPVARHGCRWCRAGASPS